MENEKKLNIFIYNLIYPNFLIIIVEFKGFLKYQTLI